MTASQKTIYDRERQRAYRELHPSLPPMRYAVVTRSVAPTEPSFVVYLSQGSAEATAHFFRQDEAQEYAAWKNRKHA